MPSKNHSTKLLGAVGDGGLLPDDDLVYSTWGPAFGQLMAEIEALQRRHQGEMRILLGGAGRRILMEGKHMHSPMSEDSKIEEQKHDAVSQDDDSPPDDTTVSIPTFAKTLTTSSEWRKRRAAKVIGKTSVHSQSNDRVTRILSRSRSSSLSAMTGAADRTVKSIVEKNIHRPTFADECIFETSRERLLEKRSKLQRMTQSQYYECLSGLLICLNAIFIGYQTEYLAQGVDGHDGTDFDAVPPQHIRLGATLFTILFCLELGLRWMSEGFFRFFVSPDLAWRLFDVFIVTLGLADTLIDVLTRALQGASVNTNALGSISVLRVLRVVRVVKLARVIRLMSFFRELRLMIYSILGCMKSLLWVTMILGMCFYIFGITFTQGTAEYVAQNKLWKEPSVLPLRNDFGTLGRSFLSLYMAMAGGRSWGEYYEEMTILPVQYPVLFIVFMTFTICAVLNIVTGVFVDSAFQANNKSRQIIIHEELQQKRNYLIALKDLFSEMDINNDSRLSLAEFRERLCDERVIAFFAAMKLDVTDVTMLFNILDTDMDDQVDIIEFLNGCYQIQGESRSIDTKILRMQVEHLMRAHRRMEDVILEKL